MSKYFSKFEQWVIGEFLLLSVIIFTPWVGLNTDNFTIIMGYLYALKFAGALVFIFINLIILPYELSKIISIKYKIVEFDDGKFRSYAFILGSFFIPLWKIIWYEKKSKDDSYQTILDYKKDMMNNRNGFFKRPKSPKNNTEYFK